MRVQMRVGVAKNRVVDPSGAHHAFDGATHRRDVGPEVISVPFREVLECRLVPFERDEGSPWEPQVAVQPDVTDSEPGRDRNEQGEAAFAALPLTRGAHDVAKAMSGDAGRSARSHVSGPSSSGGLCEEWTIRRLPARKWWQRATVALHAIARSFREVFVERSTALRTARPLCRQPGTPLADGVATDQADGEAAAALSYR